MVPPAIAVVAIALLTAFAVEAVQWALVYRTDNFQQLKRKITLAEQRLEAVRSGRGSSEKARRKKEGRHESEKRSYVQAAGKARFTTNIVTGALLFVSYQFVTRYFKGVVVAELPFEPAPIIRRFTHRGLDGEDYRQASVTFLSMVCGYSMRTLVAKVFNFGISPRVEKSIKVEDTPFSQLFKDAKAS